MRLPEKGTKTMARKAYLTPRERVLKTYAFERGDKVVSGFRVPEIHAARFEEKYGPNYGEIFHEGVGGGSLCLPQMPWPSAPGKWIDDGKDPVWWFTGPLYEDYDQADKLELPDPRNTPNIFANLEKNLKDNPDGAQAFAVFGPFTILHGMRLMDNLYTDIYDDRAGLHRLIKRVMDIQTDLVRQAVELPFDIIHYMDDMGSSTGLLMSPAMTREFIFDYFEEGIQIAKKHGKHVEYHTDGDITDLLDDAYRIGIEGVNPLQPQFNDFEAFAKKYDKKLVANGCLDNVGILPFGTPEEVRAHVEYAFNTLGKNGGLSFGCHEIRNPVSFENWEALLLAIADCWY